MKSAPHCGELILSVSDSGSRFFAFPIRRRRHADLAAKLPHEMRRVVVAALLRDLVNAQIGCCEQELCFQQPRVDDIVDEGHAELLFIHFLQIAAADAQCTCNGIHAPVRLRRIEDLPTQTAELFCVVGFLRRCRCLLQENSDLP